MLVFLVIFVIIVISLCIKNKISLHAFDMNETPFKELSLSKTDDNMLFDIMSRTVKLMENIPYFLIGGSLMGAIRYQDRMPWDDDIDIGIFDISLANFVQLDFASVGLAIRPVFFGYKIYDIKTTRKVMNETTFPFIDVFIYKETTPGRYFFVSDKARKLWPREEISADILFPLRKCSYRNLQLDCPNKSIEFLNKSYLGWDKIAYITGSHTGQRLKNIYTLDINPETTRSVHECLSTFL